jgi:pilus assembly protein FimV
MDRWEPLEREIESGNTRDDDTARLPINVPDDFIVHEQPVEKTGRDKHGELLLVDEDADSLAEVDFHIAYGSHDRAAARLTKALENAPDNRELKLRLMEVYFQWGNQKAFLEAAEELRAALGEQTNSDWDKVVIMGRQICPDERLFAEATPCAGAVDLDLQTQNSPALDLAFSEQDGTEVGVDTGGVDDTRAEPETIDDDAATVRWEAADGVAIRSKAIGDREKTAALPATSPELDVGADGIVDVGELPDPRESPTVTQERHELDMSATLDEEADASSTTVMRETPDPVATAELDANITSEMLPAGDMIDRRADDQEQPALVDDLVTQLDLARAYMSIGQPEQALPMLEGALQKADGKSKKARHMLEEALQEAEAAVEKTKRLA